MARTRGTALRSPSALDGLVSEGDGVLLLGLEELGEDAWAVLVASGLRLLRAAETDAAVRLIAEGAAPVVVADVRHGPALISAVRVRPERLPMAVEAAAYFAVSEALTNVARYAGASHACVSVAEHDGELVVTVDDDGVGGADPSGGSGLQGLRDRLAAVNGTLDIASRPGEGTLLRARLPSR